MFAAKRPQDRPITNRLQLVALAVVILAGVIALDWPITFTTATATPARPSPIADQTAQAEQRSVADVAETVNPAVVTITNLQQRRNLFPSQPAFRLPIPFGVGSGFIIDKEGHVVTNYHVVQGGSAFEVEFYDGTVVSAHLVGGDAFQDVAVLKLDLGPGQNVPGVATFGDSDIVRPGDQVVAIGSPFGELTNTVSAGTVGAVDRELDTGTGYRLPNLIQHSAPIYEGNSGGPLVNMAGEVIGMNVAKSVRSMGGSPRDSGIGFAIASNAVKEIVQQLIDQGRVLRPYLGIQSQPLPGGQAVVDAQPDSPAATAGLQPGDVITAVDGQRIDQRNPFVNLLIFGHQPGDVVQLTIDRNGQELTVEVVLDERPADVD